MELDRKFRQFLEYNRYLKIKTQRELATSLILEADEPDSESEVSELDIRVSLILEEPLPKPKPKRCRGPPPTPSIVSKTILCSILYAGCLSSLAINNFGLEDIGLNSLVATSTILTGADFFANSLVVCFFHKIKRKLFLMIFNLCLFLLSISVFFASILWTSYGIAIYNMVHAFVMMIFFKMNMVLTFLFIGRVTL